MKTQVNLSARLRLTTIAAKVAAATPPWISLEWRSSRALRRQLPCLRPDLDLHGWRWQQRLAICQLQGAFSSNESIVTASINGTKLTLAGLADGTPS